MAGLCKVTLIGNLGRDPEAKFTTSGKGVTSFSVACSRMYTGADGERKEETEWFRVSAWGKLGEICSQYLTKGSKVYIEGRLRTRTWEGQDGIKHADVEVVASDMQMLDTKSRGSGSETPSGEHGGVDANDIPF